MGGFYQIKVSFIYLDFNSTIEREILANLKDRNKHLLILEELIAVIEGYLKKFEFTDFYEMPFIDKIGKDNGYFLRKIATHKETGLKGKLELMIKKID